MENQIVINIPAGKKAIQETDKDGNIVIKFIDKEQERSKSWEEFCERHPCVHDESKDEESIRALIKLTKLHDEWVGDWKPDYSEDKVNWQIYKKGNLGQTVILYSYCNNKLLSFPTREMAMEFATCFRDLIDRAGKFI